MSKILIITNIAPLYRTALWKKLLDSVSFDFNFCFGKSVKSGIKEIDFSDSIFEKRKDKFRIVKNFFFKQNILFWQKGVIRSSLTESLKTVIISGDANVLSNWLISIIYRFRSVEVVFWSHGIYGNESFAKKNIRKTFFKIANQHLLYERRGKHNMIKEGFDPKKLHIVFNSLNYETHRGLKDQAFITKKEDVFSFLKNIELPTFIFIGRLTPIKKLEIFLDAVKTLNQDHHRVNAILVGDGSEKSKLMTMVKNEIEKGSVYFYGECYSEEIVSNLLTHADLCVSPGNVGLTAIHCLSFGTPVCTHSNFINQMPEVEVIKENKTGYFFEENNTKSLIKVLNHWLEISIEDKLLMRQNCRNIIDQYYNPEYQLKVINNMLNGNSPLL